MNNSTKDANTNIDEVILNTPVNEDAQEPVIENTIIENCEYTRSETSEIQLIQAEESINKNKPWRLIIRRKISDGGSNY